MTNSVPDFNWENCFFEMSIQIISRKHGDPKHGVEGTASYLILDDDSTLTHHFNTSDPYNKMFLDGDTNIKAFLTFLVWDGPMERQVLPIGEINPIDFEILDSKRDDLETMMFLPYDNKSIPVYVNVLRKKSGFGNITLSNIMIKLNPREMPKTIRAMEKYHKFYFTHCKNS